MPEQPIKHDNAFPGFLLILIPFAFLAVFLSVAWPFIMGAALLLTGNSVWQSYQLAKLSQQVNPLFSQLLVEKQGVISSLDLAGRASISGSAANRYLYSKAVKFGGSSQRASEQEVVYQFLTVSSLENVFSGINPNPTATQKLEGMAEVTTVPTFSQTVTTSKPSATISAPTVAAPVEPTTEPAKPIEVAIAQPPELPAPAASVTLADPPPLEVETAQTQTPLASVPAVVSSPVAPAIVEEPAVPVPVQIVETLPVLPQEDPVSEIAPVSTFGQALRSIFHAEVGDEEEELPAVTSEVGATSLEIISQADLAKRLDVHSSTIYKRRTDVSFSEWTRNRDPEGIAWGYSREAKEFYRIG